MVHLKHIKKQRVDYANKHSPEHAHPILEISFQVHLFNVDNKQDQIEEMDQSPEVVDVLGVPIPLKLKQIGHNCGVEHIEFLGVAEHAH